jgi:sugar phosphate isomerase/epimerase
MNNPIHRRAFLGSALLSAAGGIALAQSSLAAGAPAPAIATRKRPIKISLNVYCFNLALTAPGAGGGPAMTLFDLLEFCAEHGFDGIDPTGYYFPGYPKVPDDSFIHEFKRRAFKLGIEITGTGVRNNFAQADKERRAADVQLVKDWIVVASKMGAPVIRVFAGAESPGHSRDDITAWMVDDLKQCVEYGRQHGVVVGVQNHGDFLLTAEQVLQVVKLVDSEWFGVIVDTGNFQQGDPYEEIARVMPHAVNFQVKESPYGRESAVRTDLRKLFRVILASSYRGQVPIETLVTPGRPYNPHVLVPQFLKEVREAIEQA